MMARIARVEAVGYPHHVVQRGNRRQTVYFHDEDKAAYLRILKLQADLFGVEIWAYCLMNNHVHLIVVPQGAGSMTKTIAETHRLYTRMINFRNGWKGYLWQGRYKSFVLDERYLIAALRYVELNPVRAGIVRKAEDYRYSSAAAHVFGREDPLLSRCYLQEQINNWEEFLAAGTSEEDLQKIRDAELTGRPLGDQSFVQNLEVLLGRNLHRTKPGPKREEEQ